MTDRNDDGDHDAAETTPTETVAPSTKSGTVRLKVRDAGVTSISCSAGTAEVDADGYFEVPADELAAWVAADVVGVSRAQGD